MARFARAARAGDTIRGRCSIPIYSKHHRCPHRNSGQLAGSGNVYINGIAAQKVGDAVIFSGCQHGGIGTVAEGSGTVYINGAGAARIKDQVNCSNCSQKMMIIDGSANVFIGD